MMTRWSDISTFSYFKTTDSLELWSKQMQANITNVLQRPTTSILITCWLVVRIIATSSTRRERHHHADQRSSCLRFISQDGYNEFFFRHFRSSFTFMIWLFVFFCCLLSGFDFVSTGSVIDSTDRLLSCSQSP